MNQNQCCLSEKAGHLFNLGLCLPLFLCFWQTYRIILRMKMPLAGILVALIIGALSFFSPLIVFWLLILINLAYFLPLARNFYELIWLVFLAIFLLKLVMSRKYSLARTPVDVPAVLLIFFVLASLFVSQDFFLTKNVLIIKNIIYNIIFFFLAVNLLDDEKKISQTVWLILLASAFAGLYGIFQYITGYHLIEYFQESGGHVMRRVQSFFPCPNTLGAYLSLFLPAAGATFFASRGLRKKIALILLLIMATGLTMTFSFGAFGALILGLSAALIFLPFEADSRRFLKAGGVIFLIVAIIFLAAGSKFWPLVISKIQHFSGRLGIWSYSFKVFQKQPVFGAGINAYRFYYPPGVLGFEASTNYHNGYLQIATDFGLVGLLLWCWIFWGGIFYGYQQWPKASPKKSLALFWGLWAGLAGYLIVLINGNDLYSFWPWLCLALVLAALNVRMNRPKQPGKNIVFIICGLLITGYFIFGFFVKQPAYFEKKLATFKIVNNLTDSGWYAPIIRDKRDLKFLPDNCWMANYAVINWNNKTNCQQEAVLSGQVLSFLRPRNLEVSVNNQLILTQKIIGTTKNGRYQKFSVKFPLAPGDNKIRFFCPEGVDSPAFLAIENDKRWLSINFKKNLTLEIPAVGAKLRPVEEILKKTELRFYPEPAI